MLLLALDSCSPRGSIALAQLDPKNSAIQLLSEHHWQREKSHSEWITVTMQAVLSDVGRQLSDLDGILVGTGPGSFTGIRVAVTMARSLGFGLEKPVWSTDSLRLWAQADSQIKSPTLVVMNGFRDIVYAAVYQHQLGSKTEQLMAPVAVQAKNLNSLLPAGPLSVVGDGWLKFLEIWPLELQARVQLNKITFPEAHHLFKIFVQSQTDLRKCLWKSVKPLYIRGSEAEEKLRQGLLKPLPKV